jgi:acetolactate decarboxylase
VTDRDRRSVAAPYTPGMSRRAVALPLLLLLTACADPEDRPTTASVAGSAATVEVFGSLFEVMHEGVTGNVVSLDRWEGVRDLYAVGALEGLRGEVTVVGGVAVASYPDGQGVRTARGLEVAHEQACLLVAARVPAWRRDAVDRPIGSLDDLTALLAERAAKDGLDPAEPFPFLLVGPVQRLELHVIDGAKLPEGASGHEAHRAASVRKTYEAGEATLVGFYSTKHEAVFTHAGERVHLHALVPGDQKPEVTGHVDGLKLGKGALLSLPLKPARERE